MVNHLRLRSTGMALATVLMLASLFIVLILSFMNLIERDYYTARAQESSQQAFYLAFSGLQYAAKNAASFPVGESVHRQVPATSPNHSFDVSRLADGSIRSVGTVVYDNGRSVHRVLLLRPGLPPTRFQEIR